MDSTKLALHFHSQPLTFHDVIRLLGHDTIIPHRME